MRTSKYNADNEAVATSLFLDKLIGTLLGTVNYAIISQPNARMGTVLLLIVSALLCFTVFYKSIEWFEKI